MNQSITEKKKSLFLISPTHFIFGGWEEEGGGKRIKGTEEGIDYKSITSPGFV